MTECPLCRRPFVKTKGKVCGACHRPVKPGHRWHIDGSTVKHDDCANPTLTPIAPPPAELELEGEETA